ncbi:Uncharacterised protein [Salmonella enterica subsp. enterica serovar Bovismorbificans]|uniref:Uncharacterized protein n=1 Tax=Salmonella enterica subsp. enterica serovar Bovismorbificans TaxID=58097 RepID=A0A655D981_SALET|nr:Uncharacterised protein [Salmonella enterica subsp. enterica serovar Bovismorbificans]CPR50357.1 Uncharacterised protein [Salmonella enterica subsp. enterica serovar Bovismorbificans]
MEYISQFNPFPPIWQFKWFFLITNRWQRFLLFHFPVFHQLCFFLRNTFEQFRGRFIVRILRYQFAHHRQLQNGLF